MKTFKELFIERCQQEPDYKGNEETMKEIVDDPMFKVFEDLAEKYRNQPKDGEPTQLTGS